LEIVRTDMGRSVQRPYASFGWCEGDDFSGIMVKDDGGGSGLK